MSEVIKEAIISQEAPAEVAETQEAVEAQAEAAAETPEAEPKQDPIENARLEEFVKKEGDWIKKEQEYKQQLESLKKFSDFETKLQENPLEALSALGVNIDQVVNKSLGLGEPEPTQEDIINKKIEEFKAELQMKEQQKAADKALLQFKGEIDSQIKANIEKYELCSLEGNQAIEDAVKVVEYELNRTGEIISIDQALEAVESHYESVAKKYAAAKKLGMSNQQTQPVVQESEPVQETPKAPAQNTLTSRMTSTAVRNYKPIELSVEESKRRAADLLKWND